MKTELHPANDRGHADHDWLDTFHSFSFATYFNPTREQFGCLRVLNDDTVAGGTGFDLHPHNNMEIVTIVLDGALEHRDSLGNIQVISKGEVQVMSAGTGLFHAEFNHSKTEAVKFLQLWIFPRSKGLKPRYDQNSFNLESAGNNLIIMVTPDNEQQEGALWIQQDAYISMIHLPENGGFDYPIKKKGNGVFIFVIKGEASIEENILNNRDAIAISDTASVHIKSGSNSIVLFVEVPMK